MKLIETQAAAPAINDTGLPPGELAKIKVTLTGLPGIEPARVQIAEQAHAASLLMQFGSVEAIREARAACLTGDLVSRGAWFAACETAKTRAFAALGFTPGGAGVYFALDLLTATT